MTIQTYPRQSPRARLRQFVIGGLISYRALFNWIKPSIYIPVMLGVPLFEIVFLTKLGLYAQAEQARFFLIGGAIQACAVPCVFAMAQTIANERYFATLGPLLISPASRAVVFLGRTWPVMLNGVLVSVWGLLVGGLLLGVGITARVFAPLLLVLLISVAACTAFGILVGAVGLYVREVMPLANVGYLVMLLVCGVVVPRQALPEWLQLVGSSAPLTHSIEAAREVAGGASLGSVRALLLRECLVAACYAVLAALCLRLVERLSRTRGTVELL